MKFLQEAIRAVKRLDDEPDDAEITQTDDIDPDSVDLDGETPDDTIDNPDEDGLDDAEDGFPPADVDEQPAFGSGSSPGGGVGGDGDINDVNLDGDDQEQDPALDGSTNVESDDPNRQGLIRTVKSAHLVYKRECGEGGFEELWIYNVGTLKDELEVRKAILAGTDIPANRTSSEDGSQTYTLWSAGNAELVHITGLQN